jgi:hypothetical protein
MSMPRRNPPTLITTHNGYFGCSKQMGSGECLCRVDYEIIAWNLALFWQLVISIIMTTFHITSIVAVEFHRHQFQSAEIGCVSAP